MALNKRGFRTFIVAGNPVKKSDEGWRNRQAKVRTNAFPNRTTALIRTGATRPTISA